MPLAHFTVIDSHMNKWEPIYKNLFEVTIILPTALQSIHPTATHLLMENATSIKLPTYPDLGNVDQRFKYSTRLFVKTPESTSLADIEVKFNVNQNDTKQVFTWRIMKDWYDCAWNNEDGSLKYKKNMVGDVITHVHDREGHVIRRVTYHNVQVKGISGWDDMAFSDSDIIKDLSIKMNVDYWQDFYY